MVALPPSVISRLRSRSGRLASNDGPELFYKCFAFLAIVDHKRVVFSKSGSWTARHFAEIDEPPVGHVGWFKPEIVAHRGRHIKTGAFVEIRFWPFITKDVLPMISAKRSSIFPLRVRDAVAFANRDPAAFASRNSRALISFVKPRNNARRFRAVPLFRFVVIWKRAVKGIESRREFNGNVIAAMRRVRIVHAAIVFCPVLVPRACAIWHRIVSRRFLADPKDCSYDVFLPRETLSWF